jgi:spore maturation protein CgeB
MIINFIGNYQNGYVGEVSDESHIARELERLGHTVRRIPRDEWREYVIEGAPKGKYKGVPEDLTADINLIAKWHHFYDGSFIQQIRAGSGGAPVFYWVWDFMYDQGLPEWHIEAAKEADLYLSGEAGIFWRYQELGVKPYYFQMDVCDGDIPTFANEEKIHDVIFTGSYLGQGHRKDWLPIINKEVPVKVWSWNYEEWEKRGFEAYPAVYGEEYNKLIAQSKLVLGFSVEPNCWGYWSNRVGKVMQAGGCLLQEYAPGMEFFLSNRKIDYFSSPEEAVEKIKKFLENYQNFAVTINPYDQQFTSFYKAKQLITLMERYLKGDSGRWNTLP